MYKKENKYPAISFKSGKNLPNAWLRAMYIGKKPRKRECYVPLHKIYNKFDCPKTDSYEKYINWISIFE